MDLVDLNKKFLSLENNRVRTKGHLRNGGRNDFDKIGLIDKRASVDSIVLPSVATNGNLNNSKS